MQWELKRRWTEAGTLGFPHLDSPVALQTTTGTVSLGDATFTYDGAGTGWLYANPSAGRWVAGYHGPDAVPVKLAVPDGLVELEAMGTGTIIWDNGAVTIEANDIQGTPQIIDEQRE